MIYLDNAGTTRVSDIVLESMKPFYTEVYGNASSLHSFGQEAKEHLESARQTIADCINADAEEIYFTSGGSESDNWAIASMAKYGALVNKKHIITSKIEHHAVLNTLEELKKQGFEITYLPVYENGIVKIEDLKNAISRGSVFVTRMFVNKEVGPIEPVAEICEVCKQNGIIFHTDAVQAVGHLPIDVKAMNISMLSMSGHKFHAPKGVGALYCKKGTPLFNLINGGAQEKNKRAGTENLASIVGMATALKDAVLNMDEISNKEKYLRDKLFAELSKIPHSKINGDSINRLSNNFNMCFEGIEGESLILLLNEEGICASSGSACTSGSLDPSHVLLAIGLKHEVAHGSLRLTLSQYTTEQEIEKTIQVVPKIVEYSRKISPVWDALQKGERKYAL